jgi:hypothetical protein
MAELAELSSSRTKWRGGELLHIHIAPAASIKMMELAEANFVAGRGIEGDRYFLGTGTYSAKPDFREVTVFEMEVLEALARNDPPLQPGPIKYLERLLGAPVYLPLYNRSASIAGSRKVALSAVAIRSSPLITARPYAVSWPNVTACLAESIPWRIETARLFGRDMPVPRMTPGSAMLTTRTAVSATEPRRFRQLFNACANGPK